ncbi:SDR family oxidoreductase [Spongiibacter sp. KMU-166]|uniref:SDR family oxidoreductase n=1 Tax=Spongiibacter thalassae TaxID=2721624 RepID=A0ABX1GHJ7_9GAMM|nr:SDR family oxidoreductase [Spongiibacter thalassae]NKI18689.1 SDR family oxidoreductase [Spongiibacter thalassae]
MRRLEGKVAIVTGAGGSIGTAGVKRLAEEGANLVLNDIREEALMAAAEACREAGAKVVTLATDTRSEEACDEMAAKAVEEFGRIDTVWANAGQVWVAEALEQDKDFWTRCLDLELTGQWLPVRAALPTMQAQNSGSVIFSSSMTANVGIKHISAYSAAKGALQALVKALSVEFGHHKIRFNSLALGSVEGRHIIESNAMRSGMTYEEAEAVVNMTKKFRDLIFAVGRMGTPEDIAPIVAYFASDESEWVTGANHYIDGGLTHLGMAGMHNLDSEQLMAVGSALGIELG